MPLPSVTLRAAGRTDVLARRLGRLAPLTPSERALLHEWALQVQRHPQGVELEGVQGARPSFLLAGWAARLRLLENGGRQVFGFLLPGDRAAPWIEGGGGRVPPGLGVTVALTPVETLTVPAGAPADCPGLARAGHRAALLEQVLLLDHVLRLGRLTAYERVAHLLLELRHRLAVVGLASATRFPLPLTQELLGDHLGLSIVHVNRTLQQLRREGMVEIAGGTCTLHHPELMAASVGFVAPEDRLPE